MKRRNGSVEDPPESDIHYYGIELDLETKFMGA